MLLTDHPLHASLSRAGTALGLADLLAEHPTLAKRSVQRWLAQAVAQGLVLAQGQGRARRYRVAAPAPAAQETHAAAPDWAANIPLSPDSLEILAYIDQPLSARHPVGWQADFLHDYEPNLSHYLPESLRQQLHRMGRTAQAHAPAGTYSRAMLGRLLIDLSWASSHLEGNTYSRLDTVELLTHGHAAQGKAALETQMILNHKAAIELLVENIHSVGFDRYTLLNLHASLAENLLPNPADEGRIRQHAVDIGASTYRPLAGEAALEAALGVLLEKARRIDDPFEQAFFVMVHLPYLQPFADINKRCSRLLANLPLFRANLCPLTFLDVPAPAYSRAMLGVYEMTRVELLRDLFVWAYERSTQAYLAIRQSLAEPDPLRLAWRQLLRLAVAQVVRQPQADALTLIAQAVADAAVPKEQAANVQAMIVDELRRLHEGVLARYGLRPAEFAAWCQATVRRF
jgi:fido (protein-threonine AMPylation protein)